MPGFVSVCQTKAHKSQTLPRNAGNKVAGKGEMPMGNGKAEVLARAVAEKQAEGTTINLCSSGGKWELYKHIHQ